METEDDILTVGKPLYLITSTQNCWKCRKAQSVIALASPTVEEGDVECIDSETTDAALSLILCDITEMPSHLLKMINSFHPAYRKHASKTAGRTYYANFCACGANFGDHFLFMEPGGAFFPMGPEDASSMTVRELPIEHSVKLRGSFCQGAEDLIFENAKRV